MTPGEALARAVALADLRVVRKDPALGPLGRWRVRRALAIAGRELGLTLPASPDAPHVSDRDPVGATVALLQTAWLRLHGIVVAPSLGLREATQQRYWSEVARRPQTTLSSKRLWLVAGAAALVVGGAIALIANAGGEAPVPILPSGPLAELPPEREAAWVDAITDWVIALDRLSRGRVEGELPSVLEEHERNLALARRDILADNLAPFFGEEAMAAIGKMLDAGSKASGDGAGWDEREAAFAESVRAANRALFARGVGYFFDSYAARYDDGRAEAALYTFRIVARQQFLANGEPIEALHLRRLDHLNLVQLLLGYTSKRMDVAVLLVDKLEGEVSTRLGPALVPGHEMPLHMKDEDEGKPTSLEVRKRAGQVVREAYYGAIPREQQALSELGELLARRSDLVVDWNKRLEHRNIELRDFDSLDVAADYRDRFESLTSHEARRALDEIQSRLETPEQRELFVRLVARHARPVELHEVQHRIDYGRGSDFKVPKPLLAVLGVPEGSEREDDEEVRRVAYELSAYTAELARDPEWARVNLTLLSEHLYDGSGGAEGWCAVLILEGLARELGLTLEPILGGGDGADLEHVAAIHLQLLGQPGAALAKAAAALWEKWFGEPLATLTLREPPPPTAPANP